MAPHLPAMLLVLATLAGCGDSLLGEVGLNEPLGLQPTPEEVAWEVRWVDDGVGLVAGCEVYPTASEASFEPEVALGYLDAPGPALEGLVPAAVNETPDYSWSLGLGLLVEPATTRAATVESPLAGVLGLAVYSAVLRVDGDWDAFAEDFDVIEDELAPLDGAFQHGWLDLDARRAIDTGRFESALFVYGDDGDFDDIVPVDALEIVDSGLQSLWLGEPVGGLVLEDCP